MGEGMSEDSGETKVEWQDLNVSRARIHIGPLVRFRSSQVTGGSRSRFYGNLGLSVGH